MTHQDAIELVAQPRCRRGGCDHPHHDPAQRTSDGWSASMSAWHLMDVMRIGMERLLI